MNTNEALRNVNLAIVNLERAENNHRLMEGMQWKGYSWKPVYRISDVYDKLGIFDWWNETLSMSQLKQMKSFLEKAIKLGFTGYACFKVGAKYCSHGMWAHKNESTDGYSPDGDCLFHSFRSGDNYWDAELNGVWMHDKYATEEHQCPDFTLAQVKAELQ